MILLRKMRRDLLRFKTQFFSIFLMSMLGILVFVGLDAESAGADKIIRQYYSEYNLSDLWVMGNGFSDDELKSVRQLKGVDAAEKRTVMTGKAKLPDDPYLELIFLTSNDISKMVVKKGEGYKEGDEGIWLAIRFAEAKGISVGDSFSIDMDGMRIDGIVKGLVDSPEHVYYLSDTEIVYPNYSHYGFAFMGKNMFPLDDVTYNQILVDISDDADEDEIKNSITDLLDRKDIVVSGRNDNLSYKTFADEISQHAAMSIMFSAVFLLIALLGTVTTMTRVTANQRTQIGTLKALGFSKRTITFHYVSYGMVISLIGSVLGAILGMMSLPKLILDMFVPYYITPPLKGIFSAKSFIAMILSVLLSSLVSFLACRKELKDMPAVTLRPPAAKNVRAGQIQRSRFWLSLSFSTQWNLRDITRNKVRSIMGIAGVMGCALLLYTGFGCFDSVNAMVDIEYGELMTADRKVVFTQDVPLITAREYADRYKGQLVQESAIEIVCGAEKKTGTLTVIDTGSYMHQKDERFNNTDFDKEGIGLTEKIAGSLGVKKGQFIRWHIRGDDKWQYTRITKIYRDPMVQGIILSRKTYEGLEYAFSPSYFLTNMTVDDDIATDNDDIQVAMSIADMKDSVAETLEMMNIMIVLMVAGAIILGLVVLYNLGVLSFVEKVREIATLKVLGFSTPKIRGILQKQNIWLTSIGIVVGIVLGYVLLYAICQTMSDTMDLIPVVNGPTYLYTVAGTFAVSVVVNFMLSAKVRTIDMVDALKGVE